MANLLGKMHIYFYHNRSSFVEDMTKTFWCVFSVYSVQQQITFDKA